MVLELDAYLPLGGLVTDERELEQLLSGWAAQVSLDETRVNEVNELLRPGDDGGSCQKGGGSRKKGVFVHPKVTHFPPIFPCPPHHTPPSHPLFCSADPGLGVGGKVEALFWGGLLAKRQSPETYHFLDLSLGGGFRGIRKRARMGCMSHRAGTQKRHHQLVSPACHDPTSSLQLLLGPPFAPKPCTYGGLPLPSRWL